MHGLARDKISVAASQYFKRLFALVVLIDIPFFSQILMQFVDRVPSEHILKFD